MGRLTDTEAISFSLLLLLARCATHAEGVSLTTVHCPLTTVHCGQSPRALVPKLQPTIAANRLLLFKRGGVIIKGLGVFFYV